MTILTPGYLYWTGTAYILTEVYSTLTGAAGGDLSGYYPNPLVTALQGNPLSNNAPITGQVLEWTGSAWTPTSQAAGITFSGDLAGNPSTQTVVGIQGNPVLTLAPTSGQVLEWNGSAWAPTDQASGITFAGDLRGDASSQTVISINGATVPVGGFLTTGNVLQVSGTSSLTYAPLTLDGGSDYVSGLLPAGNQAAQTMGGDVSGTTASAAVIAINGTTVPATPSANQVLVATSGTTATWEQIADAQVSTGAAIAYSKLNLSGGIVNNDISTIASIAVAKLAIGSPGQILLNNYTPIPAWTTMSGDTIIDENGITTVVALDGYTLPRPSGSNTVLRYNSGSLSWASGGGSGITQLSQDVLAIGSGDVSATVVSAQDGAFLFTSSGLIEASLTVTNFGLLQQTAGSGVTPSSLNITAQAPNSGSATTSSGTPGNVNINLATPVSTGTEGFVYFTRGGINFAALGYDYQSPGTPYSLWLGSGLNPNAASSAVLSNYASSSTVLRAPVALELYGGSSIGQYITSTGTVIENNLYVGPDPGAYGGGNIGILGIANATTPISAAVTTGSLIESNAGTLTLYAAAAVAGNNAAGSVSLITGAPTGSGNQSHFEVHNGSLGIIGAIAPDHSNPSTITGLWLGSSLNPDVADSWILCNNNGTTELTCDNGAGSYLNLTSAVAELVAGTAGISSLELTGSEVFFAPAGTSTAQFNGATGECSFGYNVSIGAYGGGSYGGAVGGALFINNIGTAPTTSVSGGALIYAASGDLGFYPAGVTAAQFAVLGTGAIVPQTLGVGGGFTGPSGGGVGVLALNNAGTQPTPASVSGGVALAANSGVLQVYDASATSMKISGGGFTWTGGQGGSIAIDSAAWDLSITSGSNSTGTAIEINAQSTSGNTGGSIVNTSGNGSITGGHFNIFTGEGDANGALTISTGVGNTYNSSGVATGGGTPGAWTLNGPSFTKTQGSGANGGSAPTGATNFFYLPVTVNGIALNLILCY